MVQVEAKSVEPATFGEMLRFLRHRMQMTQQQLGAALGYSAAMVARLESDERLPDLALVKTAYVEALGLEREPELAAAWAEGQAMTWDQAIDYAQASELFDSQIIPPAAVRAARRRGGGRCRARSTGRRRRTDMKSWACGSAGGLPGSMTRRVAVSKPGEQMPP